MVLLSLLLSTVVVVVNGRVLVRMLGWPTNRAAALRWCYALLASAVLFSGLPEILHLAAPSLPTLPPVDLATLLPVLLMLGLAVLGYVAWARGADARAEAERRDAQAMTQVRRRTLPPAPVEAEPEVVAAPGGFRPRGRVTTVPAAPAEDV